MFFKVTVKMVNLIEFNSVWLKYYILFVKTYFSSLFLHILLNEQVTNLNLPHTYIDHTHTKHIDSLTTQQRTYHIHN